MHIEHLVCSKHMTSRLSITRHTTNLDTKYLFWLKPHIHRRQARKSTNLVKECPWRRQSQTSVVVEEAGTYSKKKSKNLHRGFHVAHLMNSMAISGPLSLRCVLWMQWKNLRKKQVPNFRMTVEVTTNFFYSWREVVLSSSLSSDAGEFFLEMV